nr:cilia- and flagella-associated protein 251-like [Leptinotarsa decemlineata]
MGGKTSTLRERENHRLRQQRDKLTRLVKQLNDRLNHVEAILVQRTRTNTEPSKAHSGEKTEETEKKQPDQLKRTKKRTQKDNTPEQGKKESNKSENKTTEKIPEEGNEKKKSKKEEQKRELPRDKPSKPSPTRKTEEDGFKKVEPKRNRRTRRRLEKKKTQVEKNKTENEAQSDMDTMTEEAAAIKEMVPTPENENRIQDQAVVWPTVGTTVRQTTEEVAPTSKPKEVVSTTEPGKPAQIVMHDSEVERSVKGAGKEANPV